MAPNGIDGKGKAASFSVASLLGWHLGVSINTTRCFQTVSDKDVYEAKGFSYSPFRFPTVQSTLQLRLLTLRQAHEQIRSFKLLMTWTRFEA